MPLPYDLFFIVFITVIIAALIQSVSGIGLALFAAPILVLIDRDFLPGPILTLGFCLSGLMTLHYRHSLNLRTISMALYGRVPGSLIGIVLLTFIPQRFISLCFAILIILSVVISYHHFTVRPSNRNLFVAGFLSGLMGTTTSIGGPPIALIYQNCQGNIVRAQLGFYFLIGTGMSIILLFLSDNYSRKQVELVLPLLPAIIIGFLASVIFKRKLINIPIKPLIAVISITSCLAICYRELFV